MKSPFFFAPSFLVNKLSRLSLRPIILRRFLFFSCSSSTRAVSFAVAAFLMPLAGVGVDVLLRLLDPEVALSAAVEFEASVVLLGASAELSAAACFLRFFEPGAFLRE